MVAAQLIAELVGESLSWDVPLSERLTRLTENLLARHLPDVPGVRIVCIEHTTAEGLRAPPRMADILPLLRRDIRQAGAKAKPTHAPHTRKVFEALQQFATETHRRLMEHPGRPVEGYASERVGPEGFHESLMYRNFLLPEGLDDTWSTAPLVGDANIVAVSAPIAAGAPRLSGGSQQLLSAYAEATSRTWIALAKTPEHVAKRLARARQLTPMQTEVLRYTLTGMPEELIAVRVDRSQHTVHNHLRDLYRAFNVSGRAELQATTLRER